MWLFPHMTRSHVSPQPFYENGAVAKFHNYEKTQRQWR